jgi:hypothetical protein
VAEEFIERRHFIDALHTHRLAVLVIAGVHFFSILAHWVFVGGEVSRFG